MCNLGVKIVQRKIMMSTLVKSIVIQNACLRVFITLISHNPPPVFSSVIKLETGSELASHYVSHYFNQECILQRNKSDSHTDHSLRTVGAGTRSDLGGL